MMVSSHDDHSPENRGEHAQPRELQVARAGIGEDDAPPVAQDAGQRVQRAACVRGIVQAAQETSGAHAKAMTGRTYLPFFSSYM